MFTDVNTICAPYVLRRLHWSFNFHLAFFVRLIPVLHFQSSGWSMPVALRFRMSYVRTL